MRIIVSAWPGAGGSSLAVILTYLLNYKLIQGSQIFRYLGRELKYGDVGGGMLKTDEFLQENFSNLYNQFFESLIKEPAYANAVFDTDMIGFDARETREVIGIFLYANLEERKKRLVVDKREKDIEFLEDRQNQLAESYKAQYGTDFFDIEQIQNKYDIVVDNTQLPIAAELEKIVPILQTQGLKFISSNFESIERIFWEKGKDWFISLFINTNRLPDAKELLGLMKNRFSNEVRILPSPLRKIIENC